MAKKKFIKKVEHEAPSQRRHYRFASPIWLLIENNEYTSKNWSISGVALEHFHRDIEINEQIDGVVNIDFQNFNISFEVKLEVVRITEGCIGFIFIDCDERQQEILEFLSQKHVSGEYVEIDGVFRHLDIPVSETKLNPDQVVTEKLATQDKVRRFMIGGAYLTVGLIISIYLGTILFSYFMKVRVESAVVTAPVESILSSSEGVLETIYVSENGSVKAGEELFRINNAAATRQLVLAQLAAETTHNQYLYDKKIYNEEKHKLIIYKKVNEQKKFTIQNSINQLKKREKVNKDIFLRSLHLTMQGVLSANEMDGHQNDYLLSTVDRLKLEQDKKLEDVSKLALENGYYYNNGEIEGLARQYEAVANKSLRDYQIEVQRLEAAKSYISTLQQKSPFDGQIIKLLRSQNIFVKRGETILLVEKDEQRFVEAYLTQNEVLSIGINDDADLFIPALNLTLKGKVVSINRTHGFVDEVQKQYQWRSEGDRSALVRLMIEDYTLEELRNMLPAGTPLVVYFDKRSRNQYINWILNLFRS